MMHLINTSARYGRSRCSHWSPSVTGRIREVTCVECLEMQAEKYREAERTGWGGPRNREMLALVESKIAAAGS